MPKASSKKVKSKKAKSKSPLLVVSDHIPDGYVLPVPNTTPYFDFVDDKTKAIKRPPNSFFIFRSEFHRQEIGREAQSDISKLASIVWKRMSNEDKRPWYRLQREVKAQHAALYPDYKYRPGDSRNKDKEVIDEDDDEDDDDYEDDDDNDEEEDDEPADEPASSASRAAQRPRPYPPPDQRRFFMGYPGAPGQAAFNQGYMPRPIGAHAMPMFPIPGAGVNGYFPPGFLPAMTPPNATFQLQNIPDDLLLKEMKRRADVTMLRKAEAARKKQKQQQLQQEQQEQQRIADLRRNPYVGYLQDPVGRKGLGLVVPANEIADSSAKPPRVIASSSQSTTVPSHRPTLDSSMPLPAMTTMPTSYSQPAPNQGTQGHVANNNAWVAGPMMPGQNSHNTTMPNWVESSETDWYMNKPMYEASPYYNPLPYPIQATATSNTHPATTSNITLTATSANSQSHSTSEFGLSVIDPRLLEWGSLPRQPQSQSQNTNNFPIAAQGAHQAADAGSMSHNWHQEASSSGSQGSPEGSSGQAQAVQQQFQPFQQFTLPNSIPSTSQTPGTQSTNYSFVNRNSNALNQTQRSPFNARANMAAIWREGSEPSTETDIWRLGDQSNV